MWIKSKMRRTDSRDKNNIAESAKREEGLHWAMIDPTYEGES